MQHHRAALGEAGQEDPRQVDAFGLLGLDQRNHLLGRFFQLRFVDGTGRGHGLDVIPAGHGIAAVDGHWPGGRLGHDEAGGQQHFLQGLGDRHEVVTIGPQAVQPDHTGVCGFLWFEDQRVAHDCSESVRALLFACMK
ncbi:hypothetical protein D3C80_1641430 [compost metagenome]